MNDDFNNHLTGLAISDDSEIENDPFDDDAPNIVEKTSKKRLTQSERKVEHVRKMLLDERMEKNRIIEENNRLHDELQSKINRLIEAGREIEKEKLDIEKDHYTFLERSFSEGKKIARRLGEDEQVDEHDERLSEIRSLKHELSQKENTSVFDSINIDLPKYNVDNRPIPDIKDMETQETFKRFMNKHPELNVTDQAFDQDAFNRAEAIASQLTEEFVENGMKNKVNSPAFLKELHNRLSDYDEGDVESAREIPSPEKSYSPSLKSSSMMPRNNASNLRAHLTPGELEFMEMSKNTMTNFDEDAYIKIVLNQRKKK